MWFGTDYHDMFGDPWPEEPDDPYPEYLHPFPQDGESTTTEHGKTPRHGETSHSIPPALQDAMLALLVVAHVGVFALALGPMFMFLGHAWYYGKLITAIGVVTCTYAAHRYLVYRDLARQR